MAFYSRCDHRPVHTCSEIFPCAFLPHTILYSIIQSSMAPKKMHSSKHDGKRNTEHLGPRHITHDKNMENSNNGNQNM